MNNVLDVMIEEAKAEMTDRERERFERFRIEIRERMARSVAVPCAWGTCVDEVDPLDGKIYGGFGRMACPCDLAPGWDSKYPQGKPKPHPPVLVRGRHGSRVARSKARYAPAKRMTESLDKMVRDLEARMS